MDADKGVSLWIDCYLGWNEADSRPAAEPSSRNASLASSQEIAAAYLDWFDAAAPASALTKSVCSDLGRASAPPR